MWLTFVVVHVVLVIPFAIYDWLTNTDETNAGIVVGAVILIVLLDLWLSPLIVGFMWLVRRYVCRPWHGLVLVSCLTLGLTVLLMLHGGDDAAPGELLANPFVSGYAVVALIVAMGAPRHLRSA
jgi:hypothetical protein